MLRAMRSHVSAALGLGALLLGGVLLSGPTSARASVVLALDLDDLVGQSDEIVVAEVLGQAASWSGRRIVTDVRLRVEETLHGRSSVASTIVVRRLGGNVGDVGMRVEGEPSFSVGERVLLFLRRTSAGLRVVGMSQGAMRLLPGDPVMVEPGGSGLALVRRNTEGTLTDVDAPQARPLDEVLDDVRRALAARRPPTLPSGAPGSPTQR